MARGAATVVLPEASGDAEVRWWAEPIGGLSLLERQILSLGKAGFERVRVQAPSSEGADAIRAFLEEPSVSARLAAVSVETSWTAGPSAPTLCVDGRHLFPPALLRHALTHQGGPRYRDDEGRCTWTGAGPAPPASFDGEPPGPCTPPPAPLWLARADGPVSRQRAQDRLFASLGKDSDGWFSRRLNRPLSLALTRRLASLRLRPEVATLVTLVVGILSGLVSALGFPAGFVGGALLFQAASVLDGVDGELARLHLVDSHRGAWLDTISDDLTNFAYLTGVTVGVWRALGSPVLLAFGLAALFLDVVVVGFLYWRLAARGETSLLAFQDRLDGARGEGRAWARWVGRVQPLIKRDAYGVAFLAFALAGAPWLSPVLTAVALSITLPSVLALEIKPARARANGRIR